MSIIFYQNDIIKASYAITPTKNPPATAAAIQYYNNNNTIIATSTIINNVKNWYIALYGISFILLHIIVASIYEKNICVYKFSNICPSLCLFLPRNIIIINIWRRISINFYHSKVLLDKDKQWNAAENEPSNNSSNNPIL